jgi:surfactin synthase thioesterase subunit
LSPAIDVCPVHLPGREDRWPEPALTELSVLVPALSEGLAPFLQPPFAFFGHSMGAFVAFELARQLRREARVGPAIMIVSGARAAHIPDPDPQSHLLPTDELVAELQRLGGIPPEVLNHPELVSLLFPALRADLAMCETYVYRDEPPLACPIVAYGGRHDDKILPDHLAPWEVQTSRAFQLRLFHGNHFFFVKEARTEVLQAIRDDLRRHGQTAVAPVIGSRASVERVIAGVWREVLRVPSVGLDDNFFDLGGNSLQMVQAYVKLRNATTTELTVLDLFRYPTIRSLASVIEPGGPGAAGGGAWSPYTAARGQNTAAADLATGWTLGKEGHRE